MAINFFNTVKLASNNETRPVKILNSHFIKGLQNVGLNVINVFQPYANAYESFGNTYCHPFFFGQFAVRGTGRVAGYAAGIAKVAGQC